MKPDPRFCPLCRGRLAPLTTRVTRVRRGGGLTEARVRWMGCARCRVRVRLMVWPRARDLLP